MRLSARRKSATGPASGGRGGKVFTNPGAAMWAAWGNPGLGANITEPPRKPSQ